MHKDREHSDRESPETESTVIESAQRQREHRDRESPGRGHRGREHRGRESVDRETIERQIAKGEREHRDVDNTKKEAQRDREGTERRWGQSASRELSAPPSGRKQKRARKKQRER